MVTKKTVAILGGYGVFGRQIASRLSPVAELHVVIVGRDCDKGRVFAEEIQAEFFHADLAQGLDAFIRQCKPHMVVNCVGPFQSCDYAVALACIRHGVHYVDLADARDYVTHFPSLDAAARTHNVSAITGASTVPAVSSAVIDHFMNEFAELHTLDYGVTPGNRTPRGIATIAAILSYVGKPFTTLVNGKTATVHGWQGLHRENYPALGSRWMSHCDIPDLDLFPVRYPHLRTIRFYAGLELSLLHIGLWLLSGFVRIGLLRNLQRHAQLLQRMSLWLYRFGGDAGGMHIKMRGLDRQGNAHEKAWYILARQGDGPQIPVTPAIILVKKLVAGLLPSGAYAAAGLLTKAELMHELAPYDIKEIIR